MTRRPWSAASSAALYPAVFREYMEFREQYSDVSVLPTRQYLAPMAIGEEIDVEIVSPHFVDPDGERLRG